MRNQTFYLLALATSLLLTSAVAQTCNQPEIKASIDYDLFEAIKNNAVRPAVAMYVLNKTFNNTINTAGSGWLYSYNITAQNLTVNKLDIDWTNTHFLTPTSPNVSSFQLRNMNVTISVDLDVLLNRFIHSAGNCKITLTNVNTQVDVTFLPNADGSNHYVTIPSASFSFDKIDITHSTYFGSFFTWITGFIANHLAYGTITSTVTDMLTKDIANQLKNLSMNGIQVSQSNFTATVGIPSLPLITPIKNSSKNIMTMGFQVSIVNNQTNATSPAFYEEVVADTRNSGQQLQLMFATNVMNQIGWAVHQMNMIDVSISNKMLPPDAPISMNTTALKILIPQLSAQFGMNKGVYVEVKSADEAPKLYVRDGRIIAVVSTTIEFYVDTDGARYPDEGLKNCTTCSQAVAFNSTMTVELNVFKVDRYRLGATVLNVDMTQMTILAGKGYDGNALRGSLNNLIAGMLPTVNSQLKSGFVIPVIGFLGIYDIAVNVNKNYLALELSFAAPKKN